VATGVAVCEARNLKPESETGTEARNMQLLDHIARAPACLTLCGWCCLRR
jgi:hypothetical protein